MTRHQELIRSQRILGSNGLLLHTIVSKAIDVTFNGVSGSTIAGVSGAIRRRAVKGGAQSTRGLASALIPSTAHRCRYSDGSRWRYTYSGGRGSGSSSC